MTVHHLNRRGSLAQVTAYVKIPPQTIYRKPRSRWGPGVVSRFLLAAFVALSLTWGTTGKLYRGLDELDLTNHFQVLRSWLHFVDIFRWGATSQFIIYLGLACRSGSYLIYGVNSTLVWILLATSSMLAHYSTFTLSFKGRYVHTKSTRIAGILSIILRRLGKILASLNTVWIILACLFQFGSVFDRC